MSFNIAGIKACRVTAILVAVGSNDMLYYCIARHHIDGVRVYKPGTFFLLLIQLDVLCGAFWRQMLNHVSTT